jgi:hypothetical protein
VLGAGDLDDPRARHTPLSDAAGPTLTPPRPANHRHVDGPKSPRWARRDGLSRRSLGAAGSR